MIQSKYAEVVKLVNTLGLGPSAKRLAGSNPVLGIKALGSRPKADQPRAGTPTLPI